MIFSIKNYAQESRNPDFLTTQRAIIVRSRNASNNVSVKGSQSENN